MEFATIRVALEGEIGHLTLNRPESLNAITAEMLEEIIVAARWFDSHSEARVVVVSGEGSSFSAGYDIDGFRELLETDNTTERRRQSALGGDMAEALERMRAVTVARLHGWVIGGGVVLAAACDLRVAADNTRFKIPEVQLGIALNWGGIPRLVREIGPALTKELVMTCREFSPQEAKQAGFLNRVVPPDTADDEIDDLVAAILSKPAVPVATTKEQVNAVTTALSARVGHYMDGDGMLASLSSAEFEQVFSEYVKGLGR